MAHFQEKLMSNLKSAFVTLLTAITISTPSFADDVSQVLEKLKDGVSKLSCIEEVDHFPESGLTGMSVKDLGGTQWVSKALYFRVLNGETNYNGEIKLCVLAVGNLATSLGADATSFVYGGTAAPDMVSIIVYSATVLFPELEALKKKLSGLSCVEKAGTMKNQPNRIWVWAHNSDALDCGREIGQNTGGLCNRSFRQRGDGGCEFQISIDRGPKGPSVRRKLPSLL